MTIFRKYILHIATKFESWDFLKAHFNKGKEKRMWRRAKKRLHEEEKQLSDVARSSGIKIFDLSRKFPVFNEGAVQCFGMESLIDLTRY